MNTKVQGSSASSAPKVGYPAKSLLAAGILLASFAANADVLFQEDFNAGLGQFTSGGDVTVTSSGARMQGCYGCTDGSITSGAISTVGFNTISLTFTRSTTGLDSGEAGIAEFSTNGSTWTTLESVRTASGARTVALPSTAAGQSALRIRFRINASLSSEYYTVDGVRVEGTPDGTPCTDCPPTGETAIGPDPTTATLEATAGSFTVATINVPSSVTGYGGGVIYYPTAAGTYGVVAMCPGYTASASSLAWWGTRLASWGLIVHIIDTNSTGDFPASRATQLIAALDYVKALNTSSTSPLRGKVANREAVSGHSMGGGGTLIAANNNASRTTLRAAFAMTPWSSSPDSFPSIRAATFVLGCESDNVASVSSHAYPFYVSIPSTVKKAYGEINNADHYCPTQSNPYKAQLGKYGVAWMKRHLEGDTRFDPWLCGAPHQQVVSGTFWSRYLSTCPY